MGDPSGVAAKIQILPEHYKEFVRNLGLIPYRILFSKLLDAASLNYLSKCQCKKIPSVRQDRTLCSIRFLISISQKKIHVIFGSTKTSGSPL